MTEVVGKEQLKQYIDRLQRLEQEKTDLSDDIKDVFAEAKANGYDTKAMKQVLKIMKMDKDALAEQEAILDLYRQALDV